MQDSAKVASPKSPALQSQTAGVRKPQFGARTLGSFVPRLTRKAFEKYGFSTATMITDWATIVGPDFARYTAPERLKWPKSVNAYAETEDAESGRPGAMLLLRVDGGRALDVQYKTRQIIERINAYFGYRAIADLRIIQGPIAAGRGAAKPVALAPPSTPPPAEVLAVADERLRSALEKMSAGLSARRSAR